MVTGATGFIGQELLKRNSKEFRYIIRDPVLNLNGDYRVIPVIDGSTDWKDCLDGISAIIHLAGVAHNKANSILELQAVNIDGTLRLAKAAVNANVKRFVFVSSIGVNGSETIGLPFSPSSRPNPENIFSRFKYETERKLFELSAETDLEIVVLRPTLVYGSNAPANFGALVKLVWHLPVLPFGLANNRRDFIAVQNLADLLVTCATHPNAAGQTFLASDGETVSTKQFTNLIAKALGKKVFQLPIPVSLMRLIGKLTGRTSMVNQLYGNLEVDSSNIKEVLGWTPPFTMMQAMTSLRDSGKNK